MTTIAGSPDINQDCSKKRTFLQIQSCQETIDENNVKEVKEQDQDTTTSEPPRKKFCSARSCPATKRLVKTMLEDFLALLKYNRGKSQSDVLEAMKTYLVPWYEEAPILFSQSFTWDTMITLFLDGKGFWTFYQTLTKGSDAVVVADDPKSKRIWAFGAVIACQFDVKEDEIKAYLSFVPSYLPSLVDGKTKVPYVIGCPVYLIQILGLLRPFYLRPMSLSELNQDEQKDEQKEDTETLKLSKVEKPVDDLRPWLKNLHQWDTNPTFNGPYPDVDFESAQFNRRCCLVTSRLNISALLDFILSHPHFDTQHPLFQRLVTYYEYLVFLSRIPDELAEAKDTDNILRICKEVQVKPDSFIYTRADPKSVTVPAEENSIRNLLVLLKSKLPYSTASPLKSFFFSIASHMAKNRSDSSLWSSLAPYYKP